MIPGAADFLIVGLIQKPHGIRGELVVSLETDRPDQVFRPGRVLEIGSADGVPTGERLTVERVRPFKGGLLLKVAEHGTRTESTDALRGRTLLLAREDAPPLDADEVWTHELIGMRVCVGDQMVGVIQDVFDAPGGGHLVSVARNGRAELLVPFVADLVRHVDREQRTLELQAREGLLDL